MSCGIFCLLFNVSCSAGYLVVGRDINSACSVGCWFIRFVVLNALLKVPPLENPTLQLNGRCFRGRVKNISKLWTCSLSLLHATQGRAEERGGEGESESVRSGTFLPLKSGAGGGGEATKYRYYGKDRYCGKLVLKPFLILSIGKYRSIDIFDNTRVKACVTL